jgi:hypothetical protein
MRRFEIAGFIARAALVSAGAVAIIAFFVWRTPELSPAEPKPKLASQPVIVESTPIPDPAPLLIGPVAHPPTPTDYNPPSYELATEEIFEAVPIRHSTDYTRAESYDLSYNPELRRMGMRIGSDGQPKRIAGDGEVPATWEDLRRAQGFGR